MTSPPNELSQSEAALWLARIRADDCSEEDRRIFQHWLAADPDHLKAFEAVSAMWETVAGLPRDLQAKDLRGAAARAPVAGSRRHILVGAGAAALIAGTFSVWRSAEAGVYQTEIGEQKHVVLADGSRVFLDTDTRIKVTFSQKDRQVDLDYGRANFTVAQDAKRPFWVNAAERRVLAGNATLDIRRDGNKVSVVVINGTAAVTPAGNDRGEILLGGQRLISRPVEAPTLDRPNLTPLLAWQSGRAIFDNEKLSSAIQEMNRYSTMKLAVEGKTVGDMRISGVYGVGDNVSFATSVSQLLPVKFVQSANRILLVPDKGRLSQG